VRDGATGPVSGGVERLGPLADIPVGEGRAYDVDGRQIAVFRTRSGAVHAVDAACPHAGGPLADGQTDERIVVCPLHGHTFDLAAGTSPSGALPVTRYPVTVGPDGVLELRLS
jgi:nitrite reductase/ring-hydroxylating ferredoxin subunit